MTKHQIETGKKIKDALGARWVVGKQVDVWFVQSTETFIVEYLEGLNRDEIVNAIPARLQQHIEFQPVTGIIPS